MVYALPISACPDEPTEHPEWYRTRNTVEQHVVSPSESFVRTHAPDDYYNHTNQLPDGSVTEITHFTDLMCKQNVKTEIFIVSKSFPDLGYSLVQHFRKLIDLGTGEESYCRGECIEYKTVDYTPGNHEIIEGKTLDEVLESFRIQLEQTSKILYLSNRLRKTDQQKPVKRLNSRKLR